MSADEIVNRLGIPLATFVWCMTSGVMPIVNAELFLVGVASLTPSSRLWVLVVSATAGQMIAKSFMYLVGSGVVRLPFGRQGKVDLEAARERVARWRSKDLLVFVSAASGLPPFYLTSIVAGTLRFPFARFFAFGLAGRVVRFSLLVAVPPLGRWIAGVR
ncbi:MAG TPA: VTT domain-containing protein [Anaeromyxobacter sp.]|nr:VTT domain-containing protein [Anaeromyxobacter sp.]